MLGAQRNLRILGVFARLAANGKPRYLDLMPRVWRHLQADLAHPALSQVAAFLHPVLPPPDPRLLDRLRIHMPDAIMLFAAGFGTRMGALTRDVPKTADSRSAAAR